MSNMDKLAKELKTMITASDDRKPKPYDTQAEVLRVEDGIAWVHIPGGVQETPVRLSMDAKKGDVVNVHVANGSAWITGNNTNPPTDDTTANTAKTIAIIADDKSVKAYNESQAVRVEAMNGINNLDITITNVSEVSQQNISELQEVLDRQDEAMTNLDGRVQSNYEQIFDHSDAIAVLENGQTVINTSITTIDNTVYNLGTDVGKLKNAVIIDENEPSVSVVSEDGGIKITNTKILIKATNSVAWADSDQFVAQKGVFTELRPRTITTTGSTTVLNGTLIFLARSGGHVSLKKVM